jgi:hypothetical protein
VECAAKGPLTPLTVTQGWPLLVHLATSVPQQAVCVQHVLVSALAIYTVRMTAVSSSFAVTPGTLTCETPLLQLVSISGCRRGNARWNGDLYTHNNWTIAALGTSVRNAGCNQFVRKVSWRVQTLTFTHSGSHNPCHAPDARRCSRETSKPAVQCSAAMHQPSPERDGSTRNEASVSARLYGCAHTRSAVRVRVRWGGRDSRRRQRTVAAAVQCRRDAGDARRESDRCDGHASHRPQQRPVTPESQPLRRCRAAALHAKDSAMRPALATTKGRKCTPFPTRRSVQQCRPRPM